MVFGVGTTHHVRIGDTHLLVHPNSYQKRAAPVFGARFATGDPDYSTLAFWQHFAQDCWIGGMGAPEWEDDSMYDWGVGVDTSQHEVVALARGINTGGTGYTVGGDTDRKRRFIVYEDKLYAVNVSGTDDGKIYKYTESNTTWASWKTFSGQYIRSAARFSGDLYVGTSGEYLRKYDGGNWSPVDKPKGRRVAPTLMVPYRGRLYVCFDRRIYRLKADDKWDGNAIFFDALGVDRFVAAEFHQGFLYFLSRNGHVVRTDGNATFDIFQFDGHTLGLSLKSYDGRLFVTTQEWFDDEDVGDGVLYQFSGAAVTELKRWGRYGRATGTSAMTVVARRLFYGASDLLGVDASGAETGFGLAVYDSREDAHSIFACTRDTTSYPAGTSGKRFIVDDVVYWGDRFFLSVRGHGIFKVKYVHRDLEQSLAGYSIDWSGGISASNAKGGTLISSDFDAGTPGLRKLWRRVSVECDLFASGSKVHVSYSTDGGQSWSLAGTATKTSSATRYVAEFYLEDVRSTRFKYKVQLESNDADYSPLLRSVVVSYLPVPEPNWMWTFTAVLADTVELLDGTEATQDVSVMKAALEDAYRTQQLVYFEDVDGEAWTLDGATEKAGVFVSDIAFSAPYIGPSSDGDVEYTVTVSLVEAVEAY